MGVEVAEKPTSRGWRFKCGIALFCLMIFMMLMIPTIAFSGMPAAKIAGITGVIFVSNKILLLLIIAVMGKSGFQELKSSLAAYLPNLKGSDIVGPTRHVIGLVMFCLPILLGMLEPYIDAIWPDLRPDRWEFQLLTDLVLVAGIFVLGGNFWGKVRALFIRTARVVNTPQPAG